MRSENKAEMYTCGSPPTFPLSCNCSSVSCLSLLHLKTWIFWSSCCSEWMTITLLGKISRGFGNVSFAERPCMASATASVRRVLLVTEKSFNDLQDSLFAPNSPLGPHLLSHLLPSVRALRLPWGLSATTPGLASHEWPVCYILKPPGWFLLIHDHFLYSGWLT